MKYIKNFQKYSLILEKEELKYSQTAFDQIVNIINKIKKKSVFKNLNTKVKELIADKSLTEKDFQIKIPLKEVVYHKGIKIKIGLLIRALIEEGLGYNGLNSVKYDSKNFGFSDERISQLVKIFSTIIHEKKIPQEAQMIIKDTFENDIEDIQLILDPFYYHGSSYQDRGNILTLQVSYLQKILKNPWKINLNDTENSIRHELRHATQILNNELLAIGNNFFNFYHYIEEDFKNISTEKGMPSADKYWKYERRYNKDTFEYKFNLWFRDFIIGPGVGFYFDKKIKDWKYYKFGTSKTKTDFKQKIGYIDKNHVLDDLEYHTRLSEILDEYIQKNKNIIKNNDIVSATNKIFSKIKKSDEFKITIKIKKEAAKDYYLFLQKRIEKIKSKK